MQYKVRLFSLMAVALLWFCLSSAAAEKTKITFLHIEKPVQIEWANAVIERFEQLHPHIEVELITSPAGTAYQEKVAVLTAAGVAPDVFMGFGDKLGFIVRGFAEDITELVRRDEAELQMNAFFPGVWDAHVFQGRIYGVPHNMTTQMVFYNRDLLSEAGLPMLPDSWDDTAWTWERFLEYCLRLTVKEADGRFTQLALTQATEAILPDVCWMFGGDWFDAQAYVTGIVDRVTFYTPENIRAYQAQVDLYAGYAAAGPPKGIAAWNGFAQGKIAMDWIGNWRMGNILDLRAAGGLGFSLGVAPPPLVQNRANTRWTNPLYMSATSRQKEAAWEFIKFAAAQESQELYVRLNRQIPTRRTAMQAYLQSLGDIFDMPPNQVQAAVSGSVAHSRRSIEEAIFDIPLEIIRRVPTWINPILAGTTPVEVGLANLDGSLNAYAKEVRERLGFQPDR
jgi:multiple sugar transport system substrate-binding protein